jgi:DNA gyrase subunit B
MDYRKAQMMIQHLSRRYPIDALQVILDLPPLSSDELTDSSKMLEWTKNWQSQLQQTTNNEAIRYQVNIYENTERHVFLPVITISTHGLETTYKISYEFFKTLEYQCLFEMTKQLYGLISPGAYVQRDAKKKVVKNFKEVYEWLLTEARRGQAIQRYKGLGEMNPDQLWETTMDPNTRRLLRVTVEDAIATDQIFTTLMGDQVEPRRNFIQQNALEVDNLDI